MKFTAIFQNVALGAYVRREYEFEDIIPIKVVYDMLLEDAYDFMLYFCEDEKDWEENRDGTDITITNLS